MIDTALMARFVDAVAENTRLVLVGDPHQLPSVGPGNILRELIASGMIPTSELTRSSARRTALSCAPASASKTDRTRSFQTRVARKARRWGRMSSSRPASMTCAASACSCSWRCSTCAAPRGAPRRQVLAADLVA